MQFAVGTREEVYAQAPQAPAVRWSSCAVTVMAELHTYIHTYINYLLRQVGLRQPKGWCGPADNLIKKKQLYLYKILNKIDKLIN